MSMNTFVLPLDEVPPVPHGRQVPAGGWLLVNVARAVLLLPDGNAYEPHPSYAWELIQRADAHRREQNLPPLEVPKRLRTAARHLAEVAALPWDKKDSRGFPATTEEHAGQVLHVNLRTGAACIRQDDTPAGLKPLEAAVRLPTFRVDLVGTRAALDWMLANGYRFMPAALARRKRILQNGGSNDSPADSQPGVQ